MDILYHIVSNGKESQYWRPLHDPSSLNPSTLQPPLLPEPDTLATEVAVIQILQETKILSNPLTLIIPPIIPLHIGTLGGGGHEDSCPHMDTTTHQCRQAHTLLQCTECIHPPNVSLHSSSPLDFRDGIHLGIHLRTKRGREKNNLGELTHHYLGKSNNVLLLYGILHRRTLILGGVSFISE